jgi:hypothetical protein
MRTQLHKKQLSDAVVNDDNSSIAGMDTSSIFDVFDDGGVEKGAKKAGGGAKTIAMELAKVMPKIAVIHPCLACSLMRLCVQLPRDGVHVSVHTILTCIR